MKLLPRDDDDAPFFADPRLNRARVYRTMSWLDLHLDAKTAIARTSITAWNALMRADPVFGRYALSDIGRSAFIAAFTVVSDGKWTINGKYHRVDGPAQSYPDGTKVWYEHGKKHRIGGPAYTYADGSESWYEHDKLHRIGGPALTYAYGVGYWYEHGELRSRRWPLS